MYPLVHENNPRFPHTCIISRVLPYSDSSDSFDWDDPMEDDPMIDEGEEVVVYEGACRSYDFHTTSASGDVMTSTRKLSLPVRQQEWGGDRPIPLEGDKVVVDKGSHKEYGVVIDKMPGNLGTHILWRYTRN